MPRRNGGMLLAVLAREMSFARFGLAACFLAMACGSSSEGDDEDEQGEPLVCPEVEGSTGALLFDGVDDHAKTALEPRLGLSTFTVEAWVRRVGDGITYSTGAGGLRLVPI